MVLGRIADHAVNSHDDSRPTSNEEKKNKKRYIRPDTCPPAVYRQDRLMHQQQLPARSRTPGLTKNGTLLAESQPKRGASAHTKLMALTVKSAQNRKQVRDAPSAEGDGAGHEVLVTKGGYRITKTPVKAQGSQGAIQLVKTVRSPQHHQHIKVIRQT